MNRFDFELKKVKNQLEELKRLPILERNYLIAQKNYVVIESYLKEEIDAVGFKICQHMVKAL
jgi:hypothetical protein